MFFAIFSPTFCVRNIQWDVRDLYVKKSVVFSCAFLSVKKQSIFYKLSRKFFFEENKTILKFSPKRLAIIFVDSSSNSSSSHTEVVPVPDWLTPLTLTGAVAPTIAEAEVDATATEVTLQAIKNYF